LSAIAGSRCHDSGSDPVSGFFTFGFIIEPETGSDPEGCKPLSDGISPGIPGAMKAQIKESTSYDLRYRNEEVAGSRTGEVVGQVRTGLGRI
jgi:hypothetical protein